MSDRPADTGPFRLLLVVGAAASIAIGVWGVVWTQMLETVLGLDVAAGAAGVARLYGGVMLAVGIGYALAAAQPHRNRGLLVPLFIVPFITGLVVIAGAARQEIHGTKGLLFAAYNFAYCLLYFRLYPRVTDAGESAGSST
jgi:ABC-type transport system involved in cytochrome c biogenesis permease component